MAPPLTPAYLKYLEGEISDQLEERFKDDGTPHGGAYEDKLQFVIQTYCQQHDQAGEQTAEFVRQLPCNSEFGIEGAVGGLMVLRRTRAALIELLEHDAEFLASYRGDNATTDETDRSVRKDAREFSKRNEVDESTNAKIKKSATEGEATEEQIADAAYNFQNAAETEFDVALSARDRLEPVPDPVAKPVIPAVPGMTSAESQVLAAFVASGLAESPRREPHAPGEQQKVPETAKQIQILGISQFGTTPSVVFNRAKEWFTKMIVSVAAGTETKHSFPRIRPLIDKPELAPHATTQAELETLAREIEDMTRRLRPPLSETHGELTVFLDRVRDSDPRSKDDIKDVLGSFDEMFGGGKKDTYGLGLDDWKKED